MQAERNPMLAASEEWRGAVAEYRAASAVLEAACTVKGCAEAAYFKVRDSIADAHNRLGIDAMEAVAALRQDEVDLLIDRLIRLPAPSPIALAEKITILADEDLLFAGDNLAAVKQELERLQDQELELAKAEVEA